MNRYLIAGLAGAIALVLAVNTGLADRLFNVDGRTTGTAGLSTEGDSELGAVGGAGRLVQRQDSATASAGQNTGGNTGNTGSTGSTGNTGNTNASGGTTTGGTTGQATTPPASTQPPANLEAIPALW
jgi:hypothetical protein